MLLVVSWFISILPVLNLPFSTYDTQGERLIYLPSVFLLTILVILAAKVVRNRNFQIIILLSIIVANLGAFSIHIDMYAKAGRFSEQLIKSLGKVSEDGPVCIFNCPDTLNGIYIFRNGLKEALNFKDLTILSKHPVFDLRNKVKIEWDPSGTSLILEHAPWKIDIDLDSLPQHCACFYYSEGSFIPIEE